MSLHIKLARGMIRLGAALQTMAVMVLPSDALVEFSRQQYAKASDVAGWSSPGVLKDGLYPQEKMLIEKLPVKQGRMLILGVGGGREAIPFARMGFEVTGVDFIPAMVESAIANAARVNLQINGLVQEITRLDVPPSSFDIAWLWAAMYSSVPTRSRRIQMLRRVHTALVPGGYFACQFHWDPRQKPTPKGIRIRRLLAALTLGNRSYEPGDLLWANIEFIHAFTDSAELVSEFEAGGFHVTWLNIPEDGSLRGEALLRKPGD
ncbi:MAG: class I SAM-dependent methyltransferase [Anaerolineae bacterium]